MNAAYVYAYATFYFFVENWPENFQRPLNLSLFYIFTIIFHIIFMSLKAYFTNKRTDYIKVKTIKTKEKTQNILFCVFWKQIFNFITIITLSKKNCQSFFYKFKKILIARRRSKDNDQKNFDFINEKTL